MELALDSNYPARFNASLFPLLLLSLASQRHSPKTASQIWKTYDYVVVGGGTSGSVVANRLSEVPCVRVLVLEAGPPPPLISEVVPYARGLWATEFDWRYTTTPQKHTGKGLNNNVLPMMNGRTLGGSSILNAALHIRGNRKDYDRWAEMGAKGWSFDEVLPYFKKLEDNQDQEYVANGFHGVDGPVTVKKPSYDPEIKEAVFKSAEDMGYKMVDPNTGTQSGFYDFQANLRNNQRCSTAKAYLVPAENRTNLDILPNAFVRKIILRRGRIFGVLFDYDRRTYFVRATREVILSAGAVNTAKLLMLSGIGPKEELEKHEIPVREDLPVGQNLQDHGQTLTAFVLRSDIQRISEKVSDDENVQLYIDNRTGPLASPDGHANIAFLQGDKINSPEDDPNYQLFFTEASYFVPKYQFNLKKEVYRQVYEIYERDPLMVCLVQQLSPKSRGTVTLQSSNPYDPPMIDPNYLADPQDIENFIQGMKACRRIANNRYMRPVINRPFNTFYPECEKYATNEDDYFRCQAQTEFIATNNVAGTAKMGDPDDPTTVVDPELRVKNVEGLRVVDNSVMPTITAGDTGVPAMMIGEKAADIIKQTIECEIPEEGGTYFKNEALEYINLLESEKTS